MFINSRVQFCEDANSLKHVLENLWNLLQYFPKTINRYWQPNSANLWRGKRPRITNKTMKKNKVEGLRLPNFKTFCTSTEINTVWWRKKGRWQRRESLQIGLHKCSQPLFGKGVKAIQWRKDNLFNNIYRLIVTQFQNIFIAVFCASLGLQIMSQYFMFWDISNHWWLLCRLIIAFRVNVLILSFLLYVWARYCFNTFPY